MGGPELSLRPSETQPRIQEGKRAEKDPNPIRTVAWLGPDGSFSRMAAERLQTSAGYENAVLREVKKIDNAFELLRSGDVTHILVPFENSTAGYVPETHRNLFEYKNRREEKRLRKADHENEQQWVIAKEVKIRVKLTGYHLGDGSQVRFLESKSIVEDQSRRKTRERFPNAAWRHVDSTSTAVINAANDPTIAAIASPNAAERLRETEGLDTEGLTVIPDLSDRKSNTTTFVLITRGEEVHAPTENDKTTFIMTIPDVAGSLLKALDVLGDNNVDLSKLKSIGKKDGTVSFMVSAEGHIEDERIKAALDALENMPKTQLELLGSYPEAELTEEEKAELESAKDEEEYDFKAAVKIIRKDAENGDKLDPDTTTVLAFTLHDKPRALADAIRPFEETNLLRIDTAATGIPEEHMIYLAFENHPRKMELIEKLSEHCHDVIEVPLAA